MKYTYIIALISGFITFSSFGQQEAQFMNVVNNPYIFNPAAGGLSDVMQFELSSRAQWIGYNGGPRTFLFTGNSQIKLKKDQDNVIGEFNTEDKALFSDPKRTVGKLKHIVGGRALNDAIGPFAKTSIYGSYAVHLPFTKKINIGAGVGIGWSNFRINQDRITLYENDDAAYSQFLGASSAQNILDVNAGIVLYNEKFFGGVSISQVLKNDAVFSKVPTQSYFNRHYFAILKYRFDIGDKFGIEPGVVGKFAEKSPISLDIGSRFIYNGIWLGLQYRTSNAITCQVGANLIKNIYLSYGYEHAIGGINVRGNSTHEIQLGIYIGNNRNLDKELKKGEKK